jgi:hypothetical protein
MPPLFLPNSTSFPSKDAVVSPTPDSTRPGRQGTALLLLLNPRPGPPTIHVQATMSRQTPLLSVKPGRKWANCEKKNEGNALREGGDMAMKNDEKREGAGESQTDGRPGKGGCGIQVRK